MRLFDKDFIHAQDEKFRIRLHNSLLGGKPVHLVGTRSSGGIDNLAVFNSACHISSKPPLIGMMSRPLTVPRDTYRNIKETGVWTLNSVERSFVERAHRAGDKLDSDVSEFDYTGLVPVRIDGFHAPAVVSSAVQIGLSFVEEVAIPSSGTVMLIGEVQWLRVDEDAISLDGSLAVDRTQSLSSLGLDAYGSVSECARFVYTGREKGG